MDGRRRTDGDPEASRVDIEYGERSGASAGRREAAPHRASEESRGREDGRGTSWISVVVGWLTALGASLILSGIVGAVVGAIFGAAGSSGAREGGASGLIGLLLTLLLAFLIGGYAAGRMASREGFKHGILVPVLALVVTIVLAGIGALLGLSFIDNLSGVTLPQVPQNATQGLGTILTVSGILALLLPLLGGAVGGMWGARTGSHRP